MAWFENYAAGITGTPNITVGTVTATTGTFSATTSALAVGNLATNVNAVNQMAVYGRMVNANGAFSQIMFGNSADGGGSAGYIVASRASGSNYGVSLAFQVNGTSSVAPVAALTLNPDTSATFAGGITATTGTFSGSLGVQIGAVGTFFPTSSNVSNIGANVASTNNGASYYRLVAQNAAPLIQLDSIGNFNFYAATDAGNTPGSSISYTRMAFISSAGVVQGASFTQTTAATASIVNTVTNKIAIVANGVTYYLLASTSAS